MDKLTTATHDYKLTLWTNGIKECRASGLTVSKWCEQNNIGVKNYYYWMRKIKREVFEALPADRREYSELTLDSIVPVFSNNEEEVRKLTSQEFRGLLEGLSLKQPKAVQKVNIKNVI